MVTRPGHALRIPGDVSSTSPGRARPGRRCTEVRDTNSFTLRDDLPLATRNEAVRVRARPLRRTIQREIEDNLSEKILFGELKTGQIVTVDVQGTGPQAQLTFKGVPKPSEVPDAPPADVRVRPRP